MSTIMGNQDLQCGKVQCEAKPGTIATFQYNIRNTVENTKKLFSSSEKKNFYCKAAKTDFPNDMVDPTLTYDGTKCANNSICMGQSCVKLSSINIKKCDHECPNGGVCNSNGHCHSPKGFACPYCEQPGIGGSLDSGQGCFVLNPDAGLPFLGLLSIIPVVLVIVLLIIYLKRRAKRSDSNAKNTERLHRFKFASQLSHENEGFTKLESDQADHFPRVQLVHPMAKPLPKKTAPSQTYGSTNEKLIAPLQETTKPPTKPMATPTKPMVPPTKPMVPPTKPMVPPTKPMVPPTKPMVPPAKPMAPPTKPMAPPTKSMAPPTRPMASPAKPMVPPPRPTVTGFPNSTHVQPPVRPKLPDNSEQDLPTIPKKPLLPPKSTMAQHSDRR